MPEQLGHETLAETHDFVVGFAPGTEVGTAFGPAHRESSEAVLEGLLESQELQDAQVHARVETDAALVRAQGAVALYAETPVDLHFATVVHPGDSEDYHPFGFHYPLHDLEAHQLRIRSDVGGDTFDHLPYGLMELRLSGIPGLDSGHEIPDKFLCETVHDTLLVE